jgi:hypothetical protein
MSDYTMKENLQATAKNAALKIIGETPRKTCRGHAYF